MTAGRDERAADEGAAGPGVERGELAQAVEQEDRRSRRRGRSAVAPPQGVGEARVDELEDLVETLRVARRDDEERALPAARRGESVEHRPLLAAHGRAGDEHRPPSGQLRDARDELGARRWRAGLELHVAGDRDPIDRHPELAEPLGVEPGLDAEPLHPSEQHPAHQRLQPQQPREGPVARRDR